MAKYSLLEQHHRADDACQAQLQLQRLRDQRHKPASHWQDENQRLQQQLLNAAHEQRQVSQQLRALLSALPVGVVGLDDRGKVASINAVAAEILGISPGENIGKPWSALIQPLLAPRQDDGHEISLVTGKRISIATQGVPGQGQFVVLNDLTSTRLLQEQLHQQQRLADMGKMMASLAHQIRTPLSSATLYVGNLLRFNPPADKQRHFLQQIDRSLQHLAHQVRDMLCFVRGEIPLQDELEFSQFSQQLHSSLQQTAELKQGQLVWQVQGQGRVKVNQELLIGALINLLNNALEASSAPASVSIRLSCDQQLLISISDQGQGMSPEQLRVIEQAFYSTKATGTGLGLAVVRSVVKAHSGSININSEQGVGTSVSLVLPVVISEVV